MKNFDLEYIITVIGNLCGIPIRIYKDGKQVFYHSVVKLSKDPIILNIEDILQINDHIGNYIDSYFSYYGIVNSGKMKIVIGPTRQIPLSNQELKEIAFKIDIKSDDVDEFISSMKSIIPMPYESITQTLCVLNYVLNNEMVNLKDVSIVEEKQKEIQQIIEKSRIENPIIEDTGDVHNTLSIEKTIEYIVSKGDLDELNKYLLKAPAVRGGKIAQTQLRQIKNIFIVTATLVSRAAINGGMNANDALSLSDMYIQKCELLNDYSKITNLQYGMVVDYTTRVNNIRKGKNPTKLYLDVSNYVHKHLSEVITTEKMAHDLGISRSHLSTKFKEDTGQNLYDFITNEKVAEAKRLLRYTDKSLSAISYYLGYSSQSHFNRTFKATTGKTPNDYRFKEH
jgi:AraC-like DNA-binding protein